MATAVDNYLFQQPVGAIGPAVEMDLGVLPPAAQQRVSWLTATVQPAECVGMNSRQGINQ